MEAQPFADVKNVSRRRTVDMFDPENFKPVNLFSSVPTKQSSMKKGKENFLTNTKDHPKVSKVKHNATALSHGQVKKDIQRSGDYNLICDDHVSERYWELLAEERRKALEIALGENKKLASEITAKEETIKCLQIEVDELKETVKHAEQVASILENILHGEADITTENKELQPEEVTTRSIGKCDNDTDEDASTEDDNLVGFKTTCEVSKSPPAKSQPLDREKSPQDCEKSVSDSQ